MNLSELKRLEREADRAEGIREGRNSVRLHVVKLLMTEGRSFEDACSFMKLSKEEIKELETML